MTMLEKYGKWALITGGSSGIGEQFSVLLAERGFNLVLVARNESRLKKTSEIITNIYHVDVRTVSVDLSKQNFLKSIKNACDDIEIGLLINNAGFGLAGEFLEHSIKDELEMINVNVRAMVELSYHFGLKMKENKRGGIIFTASTAGMQPMPFWTNYAATKAHTISFSRALSHELKPYGVDVLALCPGPVSTAFMKRAGISREIMSMKPLPVALAALNKLGKSDTVIPGLFFKLAMIFGYFIPKTLSMRLIAYFTGDKLLKKD